MAAELAGLLVLNAGYVVAGVGLLALIERLTWTSAGVAFPLGLVALTVPASYLALLGIPVGWTAGIVLAVIAVAAVCRTRAWRRLPALPRLRRPHLGAVPAAAMAVVTGVLLLYAARTFAVRPLIEWDAWGVWTTKARLLYVDPRSAPVALRSGNYGQTPYPIGLPTIEAVGFGAMGRYDPTLIGVQFVLFAIAFPVALWAILQAHARSFVIGLAALCVVGAPQMLYQLLTHYADVPLGLFVGLGLAAGGAWLGGPGDGWLLACFVAFIGMAGITKSEGFLFALVAAFALVTASALLRSRTRLLAASAGAGGVLAILLPWRIYCSVYGLTTPDYDLSRVVDVAYLRAHHDRVGPVVRELWRQASATGQWGLLAWVVLLALVAGAMGARWTVLAFSALWLAVSSAGLVILYWASNIGLSSNLTNTSYRTIVSLLIGGLSLVPLLVFPRDEPS